MWLGFEKLRPVGAQRGVPILREINTELMKCGVTRCEGCLSVARTLPRPGSELSADEVQELHGTGDGCCRL